MKMDEFHIGFHLGQGEWKITIGLLVGERGLDIMQAVEGEPVARNKGRIEEGEALDVIPMGVGEDEVQMALASAARAAHELMTQFPQTGTGVYDDHFPAGCNFDASGITSGRPPLERRQMANIGSHGIIILGVKIGRQMGDSLEDFLFNGI